MVGNIASISSTNHSSVKPQAITVLWFDRGMTRIVVACYVANRYYLRFDRGVVRDYSTDQFGKFLCNAEKIRTAKYLLITIPYLFVHLFLFIYLSLLI
jgi:hypothetical protein